MSRAVRLWAACLLAGLALVGSSLALVALNTGGEAGVGPLTLMRVAAGYDRRAEQILAPADPPPAQLRQQAAALSRRALAVFPYDSGAWLRLAYVDYLDHGALTPAGLHALSRSYDLVAVDPVIGVWRVRFALENCRELNPALLASVHDEVKALWSSNRTRNEMRQMPATIRSPAGRLALLLWLNGLQSTVTK